MSELSDADLRIEEIDQAKDLLATSAMPGFVWSADDRQIVTNGVAARLFVGTGPDRLARASQQIAELLGSLPHDQARRLPAGVGPLAVGSLPFFDNDPGELIVPSTMTVRLSDGRTWRVTVRSSAEESDRLITPELNADVPDMTYPQWEAAVEEILGQIQTGALQKVVLARTLTIDTATAIEAEQLVRHFRDVSPTSYIYACDGLVGATPELIVRRRGGEVTSRPMAGTAWTGWAPPVAGSSVLADSDKDVREHQLVIDDVVANLAPWCDSWQVLGPEMVRFSTVTHLVSTFTGRLTAPFPSALALAGELHPTPAVGGLPRQGAVTLIDRLEPVRRGRYAGPVGWVDAQGDGDFAIALRCAQITNRAARLFAGAGIVAGSDPAKEWDETTAKLGPAQRALALD